MFVFGEVQDPLAETVRLVEDVVRGQIIEIVSFTTSLRTLTGSLADLYVGKKIQVTRARLLTHLRSSRFLSAEDLIFLIRDDRGKVNRLRTYLSWKDVRKRAKEEEEGDDVDVEEAGRQSPSDWSGYVLMLECGGLEKAAPKGRRAMPKLPWELLTPFSDFVRGLPSRQSRSGLEEEEEEDEDEMQAYQDSMQRLRVSLVSKRTGFGVVHGLSTHG